jgi:hypothetical protein
VEIKYFIFYDNFVFSKVQWYHIEWYYNENFEDTKGVIRSVIGRRTQYYGKNNTKAVIRICKRKKDIIKWQT